MSFMFKPLAYDEPGALNHIQVDEGIIQRFVDGTPAVLDTLSEVKGILALDGYVSAQFDDLVSALKETAAEKGISFAAYDMRDVYKTQAEIDAMTAESLPLNYDDDPVLLFGRLYKGRMEDMMDAKKLEDALTAIQTDDAQLKVIYGMGAAIESIRAIADKVAYVDITPKVAAIRAREKKFVNIGDESPRPFNLLMRRNYFVDFEITLKLRKELLEQEAIDFYIFGSNEKHLQLLEGKDLSLLLAELVKYPFRAKPVYLEGIWGGEYIRKIRNIPMDIAGNIAWIFEFIPMEVSIEVDIDGKRAELPFYTFVQKEGKAMMGEDIYEAFDGYFPVRFNYDDTWHSDGNMSVQVHPDEDFIIENYDEFGRQDEAYYVIATGHGARTYAGWKGDGKEFLELAKLSEKDHRDIDYQKYVNSVVSYPGRQIMIPAGTVHASGRNQLILELGSLTIGSYTYKVYDYNRKDKDGNVRPIHTKNAEKVLHFERDSKWVDENIAIEPILVEETDQYKEYIVGKTDLMYYQTGRIELNTHGRYEASNNGGFTVLTLVDGEKATVYAKDNPELKYDMNYLDVVTVPASIDTYVVEAKGYQPVVIHKTTLREGYSRYKDPKYLERK